MTADETPIAADEGRAELDRLTYGIIGAAQRVGRVMGPGFLERVYENSLAMELRLAGRKVEQQHPVVVRYRDEVVGTYFADLLVDDAVMVELKVATGLDRMHQRQCVHYLAATGFRVCLLINFGRSRLEFRRVVQGF